MTERTRHPAAGCTKAQRAAFERIAIGDDRGIHPETTAALVRRGLVVATEDDLSGRFSIRRYHVPLAIHAQWCAWCDENVKLPE